MIWTTANTKHLDGNTKPHEVLLCYDFTNGVTDEEEEVLLQAKLNLFTIGTITLLESEIGTLVLTTKILGVYFGTEDLTFDFPHTLGEIEVDTIPMHIGVQDMKITHQNLLKDAQVHDLNLGFEEE